MSDLKLRELERIIQSDPTDLHAWAEYITTACRIGRLDPLNFDEFVTFLFHVDPPARPSAQTLIEQGVEGDYQIQVDAYQEAYEIWERHRQAAIKLLHDIRTTSGQWSAQQFVDHINSILPRLYRRAITATMQTQQERQAADNAGGIEGPDELETDVVTIGFNFIGFDETELEVDRPRPINDFATQIYVVYGYDYWTEAHGEQMSEPVERARFNNPHQAILFLIENYQSEAEEALGDDKYARQVEEEEELWNQQQLPTPPDA